MDQKTNSLSTYSFPPILSSDFLDQYTSTTDWTKDDCDHLKTIDELIGNNSSENLLVGESEDGGFGLVSGQLSPFQEETVSFLDTFSPTFENEMPLLESVQNNVDETNGYMDVAAVLKMPGSPATKECFRVEKTPAFYQVSGRQIKSIERTKLVVNFNKSNLTVNGFYGQEPRPLDQILRLTIQERAQVKKKRKSELNDSESSPLSKDSPAMEGSNTLQPALDIEWERLNLQLKWKGDMQCVVHGNWPHLGRCTKLIWFCIQCVSTEDGNEVDRRYFLVQRYSGHKSELPEIMEEKKKDKLTSAPNTKKMKLLEERVQQLEDKNRQLEDQIQRFEELFKSLTQIQPSGK